MVDNNYDFQIAVTTSDAFLARPEYTSFYNMGPPYYHGEAQAEIAHFRDGPGSTHSGFRVLTPSTPNLVSNFINNATQGINGYGDERSLQSFRTALESPLNAGFVRPDGFLAVIILTDEDDFSRDSTTATESYESSANLHPISSYVSFLDDLTSSTASQRNYSVNTISVNSQACLDSIFNGWQKIGVRVGQLADATGGVKGNLCGDFAQELDLISQSIVALSTQFYLGNKKPIPSTIQVWVNGTWVPEASQNPQTNGGWTYVSETNSLVFTGIYVPPQGAQISVSFDPESITF